MGWPMNILVLNCGSSTLKFQVIETDLDLIKNDQDSRKAKGSIERIGSEALITLEATGQSKITDAAPIRDHRAALDYVIRWLVSGDSRIADINTIADIDAVGHRIVHGAEKFTSSVLIDDEVIKGIEDCIDLAPLHNPANLKGIHAVTEFFGKGTKQVAVFDTSFHSTMPDTSYLYAIPYHLYRRHKIRRYGFHGTSHRYIAYRYRSLLKVPKSEVNIITLHLGNGCSACAIKEGKSINSSMGFSPMEGMVMGTRGGDIDPAIIEFLIHKEGKSIDEVFSMLNKDSGLLGLSGLTNDMRELIDEIEEHRDRRAELAVAIFAQRIKKYIGAYLAQMNGADCLVFTGGIGENSAQVRERICADMEFLGIKLNREKNNALKPGTEGYFHARGSKVKLAVAPTNEELLIARDTARCILGDK